MAKCLVAPCKESEHSRGLCHGCYNVARLLVKNGSTTWEKLELLGRAKPAKTRGWDSPTRKFFLNEDITK